MKIVKHFKLIFTDKRFPYIIYDGKKFLQSWLTKKKFVKYKNIYQAP